ncbi:MAG TPA: tetratricopeptide repeat protein [Syntrophobacteria bacterium]|nr:tetratricopeptide repeat protein [Syntrophobacteria bacterium]
MPHVQGEGVNAPEGRRFPPAIWLAMCLLLASMILASCATVAHDPNWGAIATKNYVEAQQYGEAIETGKQVTQLHPSYAPGWYWLGIAYVRDEKYDDAIPTLNRAIACNPSKAQLESSYYYIGKSFMMKGNFQEAIRWYAKSLEVETSPVCLMQRSYCRLYLGMYDDALADMERAEKILRPQGDTENLVEVYRTKAFCYLGLGDKAKALSMVQKAGETSPGYNPSDDLLRIAYAVGDQKKLEELLGDKGWLGADVQDYTQKGVKGVRLDGVVKESPAERAGMTKGDVILAMDGKGFSGVQEFVTRIGGTRPGTTVRFEVLRGQARGPLEVKLGSRAESAALSYLESDIVIGAYLKKQRIYRQAEEAERYGEYRQALSRYMESCREQAPDSQTIGRVIKVCQKLDPRPAISEEARKRAVFARTAAKEAKDGQGYDAAIDEYREAVRLAPWWADLHLNLALLYEQRGNYRQATESLKLFLLASPGDSETESVKTKMYELEYKAKMAGGQ